MSIVTAYDHATLMNPGEASSVAAKNQSDDPDWSYVVEGRGRYAVVVVYDEDGEKLGYL